MFQCFFLLQRVDEICNTIEECWDDEGDARLTAHCVHVRLMHLQAMGDVDDDNRSETSSGFDESSFINDDAELSSSKVDVEDEYSYSSAVKDPLLVELS